MKTLRFPLLSYAVVFCSISGIARAATAAQPSESVSIVKQESVLEGSSAQNRLGKNYFITGQAIGFAVAPAPSIGLNFGLFLNQNNLFQIELSKGVFNYQSSTSSSSRSTSNNELEFDMPVSTAGANLKHFFGNSFYTKTGLAYRKIELSNIKSYGLRIGNANAGSAESMTADIAIGNQWQWESFTLGCDWFGIMAPLATLSSRYTDEGYTESEKQRMSDSWNTIAKVTSSQALRFYLGASF